MVRSLSESLPEYLSTRELANLFSTSPACISNCRYKPGAYSLPYVKIGTRVAYPRHEVEEFIKSKLRVRGVR